MRCVALLLILSLCGSSAQAHGGAAQPARPRQLTDAVYVRPIYGGPYRHCGGNCLKSGDLTWFCTARQECALNCAVAPPSMKCASP